MPPVLLRYNGKVFAPHGNLLMAEKCRFQQEAGPRVAVDGRASGVCCGGEISIEERKLNMEPYNCTGHSCCPHWCTVLHSYVPLGRGFQDLMELSVGNQVEQSRRECGALVM